MVTGGTPRFAVRRNAATDPVLSTEVSPATASASVTDTQEITVTIEDEDTEDLYGTYQWSCELEDTSSDKSEVAWGYLTFKASMV